MDLEAIFRGAGRNDAEAIAELTAEGAASFVFHAERASRWLASLVGVAVGSVWNYAVSSVVTWRSA